MVFLPDKRKKRKVKKTKKTKPKPKTQNINITVKQPRYEQSSRQQQQQLPREQTIYNNTQLAQQYSFLQSLIDNVRKPSPLEPVKDTPPAPTSTALIVREPSQPLTESAQNDNTLLKQKIFEERRQKKMFEEQQAMIKLREQQLKKQLLKEDTKPTLKERYKKPVDMKPPTTTPPKPTQILKQDPKLSLAEEHDAKLLKDLKEGKTYLKLVDDSDDEPPKKQKPPAKKADDKPPAKKAEEKPPAKKVGLKTPTMDELIQESTKKTPTKKAEEKKEDIETDDEGETIEADVKYTAKDKRNALNYYITKFKLGSNYTMTDLGRMTEEEKTKKFPKNLRFKRHAKVDDIIKLLKDQKLI